MPLYYTEIKYIAQGFPGGSVVKNLPANAGETDSVPHPGRSHMQLSNSACVPQLFSLYSRAQEPQLSPCAAATEACVPRARAPQQEKLPQCEAQVPQPVAPTLCN